MPLPSLSSCRRRVRAALRGRHPDRGAVTVEVLILIPLLGAMLFGLIQAAMWGTALVAARAAADGAARDTAAYGATTAEGYTSAQQRIAAIAGRLLGDPRIEVTRDATTARVHIAGSSPLLPLPVSWTATAPVERFTTEGRGFANSEVPLGGN
jgi:Flp pilus assembly protein TadG